MRAKRSFGGGWWGDHSEVIWEVSWRKALGRRNELKRAAGRSVEGGQWRESAKRKWVKGGQWEQKKICWGDFVKKYLNFQTISQYLFPKILPLCLIFSSTYLWIKFRERWWIFWTQISCHIRLKKSHTMANWSVLFSGQSTEDMIPEMGFVMTL